MSDNKTRSKKHQKDKLSLFLGVFFIFIIFLAFSLLSLISPNNNKINNLALLNEIQHKRNNINSVVEITEFADIQCPACSRYHSFLKDYLKTKKNISFEFKHFPLNNIHKNAELMSKYSIAISTFSSRKFWLFLDIAYEEQSNWSKMSHEQLHNYMRVLLIERLKINYNKVFDILNSDVVLAKLYSDKLEAKKLRLRGTPTFLVNGKIIQTPNFDSNEWNQILK